MSSTYELKDRVSCPPGGFIYKKKNGLKSDMMPHITGAAEMARMEYQVSSDEAIQIVLEETYHNIIPYAREHFIVKTTDSLVQQNRTFRYVNSDYLAPGEYWYNPGLIEVDGDDWLIYRLQQKNADSTIWRHNFRTHENFPIILPEVCPNEQFEDPRVFMHNGKRHLIFSSWRKNWAYVPCLRLITLNDNWEFEEEIKIPHGGNGNGKVQKNWQYFSHKGKLHFIYIYDPWQVVVGEKVYTGKNLLWDYGTIRGGTPPVRVGDYYYTFFHSRLNHGRARYYTGAIKFSGEAPFTSIAMTSSPLLSPSPKEPNLWWAPLTTFPCGVIYRDNKFIVSMGINDFQCALADWTLDELESRMEPV